MLEPLDRYRRDSTLFQFTTRRLRDFIDPNHLLLQIDENFDFAKLTEPLEGKYCPDNGRPAIHPEILIRALLISALYNITSFRRLCHAISENIAFRWFCFLTIDDEVFDHSTITYFIERIGREGFADLFRRFNDELLRAGLLSPKVYADATLVQANVSTQGLAPSGMTVREFRERAIQENGLFAMKSSDSGEARDGEEDVRYYQDPQGRLPLSPVDPEARWRTHSATKRAMLCYHENAIIDENGFILARMVTPASEAEWKLVSELLDDLPLRPQSLAADGGYRAGVLRQELEARGIVAYIPFHPNQEHRRLTTGRFSFHGDHLLCSQRKVLRRGTRLRKDQTYQYVARRKECQPCAVKERCLPPLQKQRYVLLSAYYPLFLQAQERNQSPAYRVEMRNRKTVAEGTFASLDRLGWVRCKLHGLGKVDCEGFVAALAHNLLKAVRRLVPGGSATKCSSSVRSGALYGLA